MANFLTKPLFGSSSRPRRRKKTQKKQTNLVSKSTLARAKAKAFKAGQLSGFRNGKQSATISMLSRSRR